MTIIYITRTGLLEPLGQSQVLNYLKQLATEFQIVLVTCEKSPDFRDKARMSQFRADCEEVGIDWRPMQFKQGAGPLAVLGQTRRFIVEARSLTNDQPLLIHARSYLPSIAALIMRRRYGTPFVFDMRALWPEELLMSGRIKHGSLAHRFLRWLERRCVDAGEVVSLTESGVRYLRERYPNETRGKTIHVIPTCADLDRFALAPSSKGPPVFGCNGTVLSGWFRMDLLAAWFRGVNRHLPNAITEVVTKDNHRLVRDQLCGAGVDPGQLRVRSASTDQMPAVVQGQCASAMFFKSGVGKLGSCPTRMGETLGCGRPVVSNGGVGDVESLIHENQIGVMLEGTSDDYVDAAFEKLIELIRNDETSSRCREVAERVFSLRQGVAAYAEIYRELRSKERN